MLDIDQDKVGLRLNRLRRQAGLGLRELSRLAGLSPAALSAIEKGRSSPTLATLHKLLRGLGTDFVQFFVGTEEPAQTPVFSAGQMQTVEDVHRKYVFLLPKREDLRFEMLMETIGPAETDPEWELHDCDVGGLVLSGGPMRLEIEGQGEWTVKEGDSFYVKANQRHRAMNLGAGALKIITVFDPPRY